MFLDCFFLSLAILFLVSYNARLQKYMITCCHNFIFRDHEKTACSICGAMIGVNLMQRHMENKHTTNDEKKYKCEFCVKRFNSKPALKDHVNTHTGEKPYLCKYCGSGFASVGNHRMHERSHMGYKRQK